MAKADGSYLRELAKTERQDVIILDDFGLQVLDSNWRNKQRYFRKTRTKSKQAHQTKIDRIRKNTNKKNRTNKINSLFVLTHSFSNNYTFLKQKTHHF
jgi:hypothetical protein